ncbi:hypothetical protein HK098_008256 [Nowakowskiella sp. JEL0407]|nr:hypothetical protein HK098_008256 [Nowakowskiella sp. JEL0407]
MVWVKNPGQFESVTTQKTDFPVWPNIEPPKVRERRKYFSTPGFSDKTTNKDDYRDFGAQPKYQIPRKPYIPNNYKFDYHTTQQEDFRDTGKVARPTPHKAAPYIQVADNRDFQSTNNMTYRSLQSHRELKGPDRERELLEGCKFRGSTTTAEAFQVWELPPRETKKEVQIIKTDAPLEAVTTYGESFYAKKLQPRETINKDTSSAATNLKFEATSTNRADYKPNPVTGVVKKPKQVYVTVDDTRDFKTSTNFYFNKKEIPHCDASLIANLPHEKRADGHIYVKAQP